MRNVFIYKNPDTFQKARQFALRFYIQKARHFTLRNFSWNFWSWHLYTKIMSLCVTWRFYIQKTRHFEKSKTICVMFLYTKSRTLCITQFSIEFLKFTEGGIFKGIKQFTLRYIFIWKKQCNFCDVYKKLATLRYIFICKKQCILCYVFISKIYPIALIPNYKRTYDQIDQIEKQIRALYWELVLFLR